MGGFSPAVDFILEVEMEKLEAGKEGHDSVCGSPETES